MTNVLSQLLAERGHLVADGAMGTNLFAQGLETGDCPEIWNVDHPERIARVHDAFLAAGSDIVLTNSFGGTRHRLKLHAADGRVEELNRAAAAIARDAADRARRDTGRQSLVAGSMGPTGELFAPLGALTHDEGVAAFGAQARALAEGGVDLLWVETISSAEELAAAVEGARPTGLPIVCTMTFDTNGRTMMGLTPAAFVALADTLEPAPVAIGANCGIGPSELVQTVLDLTEADADRVVVAKGNCGIPEYVDGHIVYSGTPDAMASYARLARDAGARIVGGCCGSTAEHVRAIAEALDGYTPRARPTLEDLSAVLGAPWQRPGGLTDREPEAIGEGGGRRRSRRRRAG